MKRFITVIVIVVSIGLAYSHCSKMKIPQVQKVFVADSGAIITLYLDQIYFAELGFYEIDRSVSYQDVRGNKFRVDSNRIDLIEFEVSECGLGILTIRFSRDSTRKRMLFTDLNDWKAIQEILSNWGVTVNMLADQ